MKKKSLNDILSESAEKRSIRNIPLPKKAAEESAPSREQVIQREERTEKTDYPKRAAPKLQRARGPLEPRLVPSRINRRNPRKTAWVLAVLSVLILVVSFMSLKGKAIVDMKPEHFSIPLENEALSALKENTGLSYASLIVETEEKTSLPKTGEKDTESKASGNIVIFNDFSSAPQTLVAGTRFETQSGLIFRLEKTATVPGQKTVGGQKTPGSLEVKVVADQPGAEYNIPLSDFTIPGFKSTPQKFEKIFARSKTPIGGGFKGKVAIVDENDRAAALKDLEAKIENSIEEKISSEIPADFFMPEGAYEIVFESTTPSSADSENAEIVLKAKIKAFIFNETEFASHFADQSGLEIPKNSKFKIQREKLVLSSIKEEGEALSATLSGTLDFKVAINPEEVANLIRTKPKKQALKEIEEFVSGLESVRITLKPFWKRNLPNDPAKIEVVISES